MVPLLLLLVLSLASANVIVVDNPCASDADCSRYTSGVCSHSAPRRCMCPSDTLLDPATFRCWPDERVATQTYLPRMRTVHLAEHQFAVIGEDVADAIPELPRNWTCSGSKCRAYADDESVVFETGATGLVLDDTQPAYLPLAAVSWRCLGERLYVPVPASEVLRPDKVPAIDSFTAFCKPCTEACGLHGSCDENSTACVCDPGFSGTWCETPSSVVAQEKRLEADAQGWSLLVAQTCEEDTDCGTQQRCYRTALSAAAPRVCFCEPGYWPLLDDGNPACGLPAPGADSIEHSAVLSPGYAHMNVLEVADSPVVFVVGQNATFATLLTANNSIKAIDRDGYFLFLCTAAGVGYLDNAATIEQACGGAEALGLRGVDTELTTDAADLRCKESFDGPQCAGCTEGLTGPECAWDASQPDCDQTLCSDHGTCTENSPYCRCDTGYYMGDCSREVVNCRAEVCGGDEFSDASCYVDGVGRYAPFCVCSPGAHGIYCNETAEYCSQTRCSGVGACVPGYPQLCDCPAWATGADCSGEICLNGGEGPSENGTCDCTSAFAGVHCELSRCGWGYWSEDASRCVCVEGIMSFGFDEHTGNCSRSLCGDFGTPQTNTSCQCLAGYSDRGGGVVAAFNVPRCLTDEEFYTLIGTPIAPSSPGSDALSPGAISGISIAAALAVGIVVFLVFIRHKQKKSERKGKWEKVPTDEGEEKEE